MLETGLVDPYPITIEFPDDWSRESADVLTARGSSVMFMVEGCSDD